MSDNQRVYLVDVETGRVISYTDDLKLCEQVKSVGTPVDPTGEKNIRISFAYGNEMTW